MNGTTHRHRFSATALGGALAIAAAAWLAGAHGIPFVRSAALLLLGALVFWTLYRLLGLDPRARRRRRLLGHDPEELDGLTGAAFEDWVACLLDDAGFDVTPTPRTRDFGVDLIACRDGRRIGIEAKRQAAPVTNAAVRSVIAGCQFHRCDAAAVVTQSSFTPSARDQAARSDLDVLLIGRDQLHDLPRLLMTQPPAHPAPPTA